ncbi:hypothetical protein LARI1_G003408 [Lachnellula arida]|uniref:BTB domain-containing protein n=1 Tax=Lachnellula arida TaxID=1316785 RepID=A0A8T9BJM0_9HELO|nr:hypothetical protein LARI1_G003408 [Lachnellula arida]
MAASHQTQVEYKKLPTLSQPQDTVAVYVRLRKEWPFEKYTIHKNFICYYSGYFDAAFNSSFKEGESQEVYLEDTRPLAFGIFVNWMYTQKLVSIEGPPFLINSESYAFLWVFAEMRMIPMLQNQALRELDQLRVKYGMGGYSVFRFSYENTTNGSPLRRYLVDNWDNRTIDVGDDYPRELLVDLVNSFKSRRQNQPGRLSEAELEQYFVDEEPVRRIRTKSATDITDSPANQASPSDASTSSKRKRDETTTEGSNSRSKNTSNNSI